MLVLKQTIPRLKVLIFNFLELEGQGCGTIITASCLLGEQTIFLVDTNEGLILSSLNLESLRAWHYQEGVIYSY